MSTQIRGEQIRENNLEQLSGDPVSPRSGQTWVKATVYTGSPIGLLLSLTYASYVTYQLSYKTYEGPIVRTNLG